MLAGGESSTTLAAGTVLTRYACAAAALGSASSASTAASADAIPRRLLPPARRTNRARAESPGASVSERVAFDVLVKGSLRVVLPGVHVDDLARGVDEDRGREDLRSRPAPRGWPSSPGSWDS